MLKIGIKETTTEVPMSSHAEDNNKKSYGKQLSVQELFDGINCCCIIFLTFLSLKDFFFCLLF